MAAKEQANLQAFQKEILLELKAIKESLLEESKAGNSTANDLADDVKDSKIAELEADNRRLNYRVVHLTRSLREVLSKKWCLVI